MACLKYLNLVDQFRAGVIGGMGDILLTQQRADCMPYQGVALDLMESMVLINLSPATLSVPSLMMVVT